MLSATEIERALEVSSTSAASIDADVTDPAARAWADFAQARSPDRLYASWLAIVCAQVGRVRGAMLLARIDTESTYAPAAIWPDATRDMAHLAGAAKRAISERQSVTERGEAASGAQVACPIEVAGVMQGAVVLELVAQPQVTLAHALRQLHWGTGWLVDSFRQRDFAQRQASIDRLAAATALVATAVQENQFQAAALAVVNEIARRLDCARVSIGVDRNGECRVSAISHTAAFDARSALAHHLGDAMDEVLDLGSAITFPGTGDDALLGAAHALLAQHAADTAILSMPLSAHGQDWGALTLERTEGATFDAPTLELAHAVGLLLGPVLALKRDNERSIARRARDALGAGTRALFGPRHPGRRLLGAVALLLVLFVCSVDGEHRVAAKTVVEGAVQRAVVAPFEGYIAEGPARAGDIVSAGQLLARLDDKDLLLERTKWDAEREQHLRKYRQALATRDRASMNVLGAQVNQAEAQLQLIDEKLARARIRAPFDGVVVSGDLSQLLGTPIEQGKTLFEIAPLDAYRVILKVDERDVGYVATEQRGELALSGMPGARLPFAVARITPVSTPEEGHNFFRVEARLAAASERLRPGMEGVGKVSVGERRLIWIWTHKLVDWLRLAFWTWTP